MTDRSEAAFDRGLTAAARSLVVAPLLADVLAAPPPVATRTRIRSEAPLAAAAAIVILAFAFAIGAPRGPGASPAPVFRAGSQISYDLRSAGYACRSGATASPGQPRMDAIVCTTTTTQMLALAMVVSEDRDGRVGEIHVTADPPGTPSVAFDRDRSDRLRELIGLPFADPSDAAAARAWLADELTLDAGGRVRSMVDGTPVVLERVAGGGYRIVLGDLHAGPSGVPSG